MANYNEVNSFHSTTLESKYKHDSQILLLALVEHPWSIVVMILYHQKINYYHYYNNYRYNIIRNIIYNYYYYLTENNHECYY